MEKNAIVLTVFLFIFSTSFAQWTVYQDVLSNTISCSFALSENSAIIAGSDGLIYKTHDGGNNWELLDFVSNEYYRDIYFWDEQNGQIVGSNGIMLTTENGGESWDISYNENLFESFTSIEYISDSIGFWGTASRNRFYRTRDKGQSFDLVAGEIFSSYTIGTQFINDSYGISANYDGSFFISEDGGFSWNHRENNYSSRVHSFHMLNQDYGILVTDNGQIQSILGEEPYISTLLTVNEALLDVFFLNETEGYVVGSSGNIYTTFNRGESWNIEEVYSNFDNYGWQHVNKIGNYIYAFGEDGIYARKEVATSLSEVSKNERISIFPNPTSDYFKVKGSKSSLVTTEIFDSDGMLVVKIQNGNTASISGLPKGIYFVRIECEGEFHFDKLIKK